MPHSVPNDPHHAFSETHKADISHYYWNTNLPAHLQTTTCPDYLLHTSEKNKSILGTPDSDYVLLTWPQCKDLVFTNQINRFQRKPSELRRYLKYVFDLERDWGSVLEFMRQERVGWGDDLRPKGKEGKDGWFAEQGEGRGDWKVLWNDWPYGVEQAVGHLVVWTKFELPVVQHPGNGDGKEEGATEELTSEAKQAVEKFVERTFCGEDGVKRENVIWFKNWRSLKSVHALEHFHVMLSNAPGELIEKVTGGDRPMSAVLED